MKIIETPGIEYLDQIVACQMQMALETEGLELNQATLKKGVQAVLDDKSKGQYFLIEKDAQILAMLLTLNEWSDWRNKNVLWIHSVYVLPGYRGQGLYKKLYVHIKEKIQHSDQFAGIRLYVDKTNQKAQDVYQKLAMNNDHYELYEWLKD